MRERWVTGLHSPSKFNIPRWASLGLAGPRLWPSLALDSPRRLSVALGSSRCTIKLFNLLHPSPPTGARCGGVRSALHVTVLAQHAVRCAVSCCVALTALQQPSTVCIIRYLDFMCRVRCACVHAARGTAPTRHSPTRTYRTVTVLVTDRNGPRRATVEPWVSMAMTPTHNRRCVTNTASRGRRTSAPRKARKENQPSNEYGRSGTCLTPEPNNDKTAGLAHATGRQL